MSSSSSEVMQQGDEAIESLSRFPNWVEYSLLGLPFFEKCERHDDMVKSEVNRYCISCDESVCRYCIVTGPHHDHKILTIYRHVYQNVVPLSQMENHMDCHRIQPYKCNKKWVVSLTPLPHNGSGSLIEGDGACYVCKRKLTDPDRFRFCSIACKVSWDSGRSMMEFIARGKGKGDVVVAHTSRKRSRKGNPIRAPSK